MRHKMRVNADARLAEKRFKDMRDRSKDFRAVMRWAKRHLERMNRLNFTANGLPSGGWDPLDPEYSMWKKTQYPGAPKMIATGKLFRSLTNFGGPASRIYMTKATFGTTVEYAKFHQYGTTKMPKRRIIYEPRQFAQELAEQTGEHIVYGRTWRLR